jgi:hypothetical protein
LTGNSRQPSNPYALLHRDVLHGGDRGGLRGVVAGEEGGADRVPTGSDSSKSTTCRKKPSGTWIRMPAPSPVSGSPRRLDSVGVDAPAVGAAMVSAAVMMVTASMSAGA